MNAPSKIGAWLSAALDDPTVCAEFKSDIMEWFEAGEPGWTPWTPEAKDSPDMEVIFLRQKLDQQRLAVSMIRTQIRNAVADLEDGDPDEAIETLKQLTGD